MEGDAKEILGTNNLKEESFKLVEYFNIFHILGPLVSKFIPVHQCPKSKRLVHLYAHIFLRAYSFIKCISLYSNAINFCIMNLFSFDFCSFLQPGGWGREATALQH
jgi:hypothetical protein